HPETLNLDQHPKESEMETTKEKTVERYIVVAEPVTGRPSSIKDWHVYDRVRHGNIATFKLHAQTTHEAKGRAQKYADTLNFRESGGECSEPPENTNTMVGGGGDREACAPKAESDEPIRSVPTYWLLFCLATFSDGDRMDVSPDGQFD